MKKTLILIMSLMLLLSDGLLILAEEIAPKALPVPRILPGNIVYPFKVLGENIKNIFTFGLEARLRRAQELALIRLTEIKALTEKEKNDRLNLAIERYQLQKGKMMRLINRGGDFKEDLIKRVTESADRHLNILDEIMERSPEEAKRGLNRAMMSAERLRQTTQQILNSDNQDFSASERPTVQQIQTRIRRDIQPQLEKIRGTFDQK